jgi:hypothetical protein
VTIKAQPTKKEKQQYYLNRVEQLFEQVKKWVPEFEIKHTKKHPIQDETGKYNAPFLSIVNPNIPDGEKALIANLLPQGTSVLMGEGLVEIAGPYGRESIIYMLKDSWVIQDRFGKERQMYQDVKGDGWYWLESSHRNKASLVDQVLFTDLLKIVSLYDHA